VQKVEGDGFWDRMRTFIVYFLLLPVVLLFPFSKRVHRWFMNYGVE